LKTYLALKYPFKDFYGEVYEQNMALEMFNDAVRQGQTAGLVQKE